MTKVKTNMTILRMGEVIEQNLCLGWVANTLVNHGMCSEEVVPRGAYVREALRGYLVR